MIKSKAMFFAAAAVTMVAYGDGAKECGCFRPPAVPLVSVDPHFSLWSAADRLYDADTTFWTGRPQPLSILLEADGITYRLCGRGSRAQHAFPVLQQTECRVGATAAALKDRLGCSWEEMNATDDPTVRDCARKIADDLFRGVDLSGVTNLVGIGNALVLNSALQKAVEERSDLVCRIPACPEMAAYGAALRVIESDIISRK